MTADQVEGQLEPRERQRAELKRLEELFGGRVLAWVGGLATLLGIVFLVGIALERGWIDEPLRIIFGFLGSTSLLLTGFWLYERRGRTEAALAAVGSGLAGLYATLLVGTQVYDLIPSYLGLACAALVGVVGVAIAVRWQSALVAAIGILGGLSAPALVGSGASGVSLAFMAIALTTAVGVLLWQKWNWLSLGAFLVSAPQLLSWIYANQDDHLLPALGVLVGFWLLYLVASIGYELRTRTSDQLPVPSLFLLLADVVLIAAAGYFALEHTGHPNGAAAWLLGFAAGHILLGALALRQPINSEIGSLLVAVGMGLSALGFADALDGPVLAVGWAMQAAVLAYMATRASRERGALGSSAERLLVGAGVSLGLALGHVLLFEAPPGALVVGVGDLSQALLGLAACAAAALYGRFALRGIDPRFGYVCEAIVAATLLYMGSLTIVDTLGVADSGETRQMGQALLSAFWTVTGLGAVLYGLLRDVQRFRIGGLGLLALAITKVYTYDLAALEQLPRVLSFIALGLFLLAGAFAYQRLYAKAGDDVEGVASR
jgi:uncharacterized membrane protein